MTTAIVSSTPRKPVPAGEAQDPFRTLEEIRDRAMPPPLPAPAPAVTPPGTGRPFGGATVFPFSPPGADQIRVSQTRQATEHEAFAQLMRRYEAVETIQTFDSDVWGDGGFIVLQARERGTGTWHVFVVSDRPQDRYRPGTRVFGSARRVTVDDFGADSPLTRAVLTGATGINASANRFVSEPAAMAPGNGWDGLVGFLTDATIGTVSGILSLPSLVTGKLVSPFVDSMAGILRDATRLAGGENERSNPLTNLVRIERLRQALETDYLGQPVEDARLWLSRNLGANPASAAFVIGSLLTMLLPSPKARAGLVRAGDRLSAANAARTVDPTLARRVVAGLGDARFATADIVATVDRMSPEFMRRLSREQPDVFRALRDRLAADPAGPGVKRASDRLSAADSEVPQRSPAPKDDRGASTDLVPGRTDPSHPDAGVASPPPVPPRGGETAPLDAPGLVHLPRSFSDERERLAVTFDAFGTLAGKGRALAERLDAFAMIGARSRSRVRNSGEAFAQWEARYSELASSARTSARKEDLSGLIGAFNSSEIYLSSRRQFDADPVTGVFKRMEDSLRDITSGYAAALAAAAADPAISSEARAWARTAAATLLSWNETPERLVTAGLGDRPPGIALDAFDQRIATLKRVDAFLSEVSRVRTSQARTLSQRGTIIPPVPSEVRIGRTDPPAVSPRMDEPTTRPPATTPVFRAGQTLPPAHGGAGLPDLGWPAPNPSLTTKGNARAFEDHRAYIRDARAFALRQVRQLDRDIEGLTIEREIEQAVPHPKRPQRAAAIEQALTEATRQRAAFAQYAENAGAFLRTRPETPALSAGTVGADIGEGTVGRPEVSYLEPNPGLTAQQNRQALELEHRRLRVAQRRVREDIADAKQERDALLRARDAARTPDERLTFDAQILPLERKIAALEDYRTRITKTLRSNDFRVAIGLHGIGGLGDVPSDQLIRLTVFANSKTVTGLIGDLPSLARASTNGDAATVLSILGKHFGIVFHKIPGRRSSDLATDTIQDISGRLVDQIAELPGKPLPSMRSYLQVKASTILDNTDVFLPRIDSAGNRYFRLNVTEAPLPPGGTDIFGGAGSARYFRLNGRLVVDKIAWIQNTPFVGPNQREVKAVDGGRIELPPGTLLPEEFVRHVDRILGDKHRLRVFSAPGKALAGDWKVDFPFEWFPDRMLAQAAGLDRTLPRSDGLGQIPVVQALADPHLGAGAYTIRSIKTISSKSLIDYALMIAGASGLQIPAASLAGIEKVRALLDVLNISVKFVSGAIPRAPVAPHKPPGPVDVVVDRGLLEYVARNPDRIAEIFMRAEELPPGLIRNESRTMPTAEGTRTKTVHGDIFERKIGSGRASDARRDVLLVVHKQTASTPPEIRQAEGVLLVPQAVLAGLKGDPLSADDIASILAYIEGLPAATNGLIDADRASEMQAAVTAQLRPGARETGNGRSMLFKAIRFIVENGGDLSGLERQRGS